MVEVKKIAWMYSEMNGWKTVEDRVIILIKTTIVYIRGPYN